MKPIRKQISTITLLFAFVNILLIQFSVVNAFDLQGITSLNIPTPEQGGSCQPTPISNDQSISGVLGDGDECDIFGFPADVYSFTPTKPSQSYQITVISPVFSADSLLLEQSPTDETGYFPVQDAFVFEANRQVQYSGTLANEQQHLILVSDLELDNGGDYTITLSEVGGTTDPGPGPVDCVPTTEEAPIAIGLNSPLTCELNVNEFHVFEDQNGGLHFAKFFEPAAGGSTISASSPDFTPIVITTDAQFNVLNAGPPPLQLDNAPFFFIISDEVEATGQFTVELSGTADGPGPSGSQLNRDNIYYLPKR